MSKHCERVEVGESGSAATTARRQGPLARAPGTRSVPAARRNSCSHRGVSRRSASCGLRSRWGMLAVPRRGEAGVRRRRRSCRQRAGSGRQLLAGLQAGLLGWADAA